MTGILLAAIFSWGCKRANDLGISQKLKEYALSEGKSHSEKEIRKDLEKLFSYFYYRIIALANNIKDPFDEKVARAHWIGSELLDNVERKHIRQVVKEARAEGRYDEVILARIFKPFVKTNSVHHNVCAMSEKCKVVLKHGYFYHIDLDTPRIKAESQDVENFAEHGGK